MKSIMYTFTTIFALLFFAWAVMSIVKAYDYNVSISSHISRAAISNTVELAEKELSTALQNIEERGMTSGNTGIIFKTPSKDVGFWYENLSQSLAELKSISDDATQLEKTNILMKLRESITGPDNTVIEPSFISIYPNNLLYFIWGCMSAFLTWVFAVLSWFYSKSVRRKSRRY